MVKRENKRGMLKGKKGIENVLAITIIIVATTVVVIFGILALTGKLSSAIKFINDLISFK